MMLVQMSSRSRQLTGLVLAVLLMAGASAQALSALLCDAGLCGQGCAMAAEPPEKSGCCPESQTAPETEKKPGCCCKIESAKDATIPQTADVLIPHLELPAMTVPAQATLSVRSVRVAGPIFGFTDTSPPRLPAHVVCGRAPPSV